MQKAVIFDNFGVLYLEAGEKFLQKYKQDLEINRQIINLNKQADYGFLSQEEWEVGLSKIIKVDLNIIKQYSGSQNMKKNEKLFEYLLVLRSRGVKTAILSNSNSNMMSAFFSNQDLKDYFDLSVFSSDIGILKPDQRIFEYVSDHLLTDVRNCFFTDDNKVNCQAAESIGMRSIKYENNSQIIHKIEEFLR